MSKLQQRIQEIEKNIQAACQAAGRDRSEITVVAVTKAVGTERTKEVLEAGIVDLGENRPEGLTQKQAEIESEAVWHYIGNVQSRRVRDIVGNLGYLHSLSRASIAKELQKRATEPVNCFVQVNVSGEASKSGVTPEALEVFIEDVSIYDKVRIVGLMTMAPYTDDTETIRSVFREMKELRDRIVAQNLPHAPCTELSMGMSNDYEIAIEEGATYLRIGTALVGVESEA